MTCTCGHDADTQHDGHDGTPRYDGPCRECLCPAATDDPSPVLATINGRWPLLLPPYRAYRPQWGWWEAIRLGHMAAYIRPDDVILDVGAEAGDLSVLWASWVPDGGVVLAEPNPKAWPSIRACIQANGFEDRMLDGWVGFLSDRDDATSPEQAAWVAEHVGDVDADPPAWPSCAYGPIDPATGFLTLTEYPHVPALTLDTLVAATGKVPTVITMDVEGAEYAVLAGAAATLDVHRPVLWLSLHPQFLGDYGRTLDDVYLLLWDAGYGTRFLAEDHEQHVCAYPRERAREFEL